MFRQASRLHRSVLRTPPRSRTRFSFGVVAHYPEARGAAVVVSKKVFSSAVLRNQLRRRIRHILAKIEPLPGIVVYPTREALTASHTALRAALEEVLRSR